jgi:hypothetical protein
MTHEPYPQGIALGAMMLEPMKPQVASGARSSSPSRSTGEL